MEENRVAGAIQQLFLQFKFDFRLLAVGDIAHGGAAVEYRPRLTRRRHGRKDGIKRRTPATPEFNFARLGALVVENLPVVAAASLPGLRRHPPEGGLVD